MTYLSLSISNCPRDLSILRIFSKSIYKQQENAFQSNHAEYVVNELNVCDNLVFGSQITIFKTDDRAHLSLDQLFCSICEMFVLR